MRITRKTEYAIRTILYLSSKKPNTKVMAKEISEIMNIPKQFLAQVMLSLNHHGVVNAIRGAKGGFILAKKPSSISLLDVIEAIEGKLFINDCLVSRDSCSCQSECPVEDVWSDAQDALVKVLKKANFSSMVKKAKYKDKFIDQLKDADVCCKPVYVKS